MFEKLKVLAARLDELEMRLSAPDLYDESLEGVFCRLGVVASPLA